MLLKFLNGENSWCYVESEFISVKYMNFKEDKFQHCIQTLKDIEEKTDYENPEDKTKAKEKIYSDMFRIFVDNIPCYEGNITYALNNANVSTEEKEMIISPFVGVEEVLVIVLNNNSETMTTNTRAIVLSKNHSYAYIFDSQGKIIEAIR